MAPTITIPEQAHIHGANEKAQGRMTQQQHQQQPHQQQHQQQEPQLQQQISSASSVIRPIASLFSAESDELDATALRNFGDGTGKTLQALPHHGGSGKGLQGGQTTPDPHADGGGDGTTGSTASDHKSSSEAARDSSSSSASSSHLPEYVPSRFSIFWRNHISVVVHVKDARDHLALERTYLAYHRTGLMFAILATVTAQLTVINHAPSPSASFGFYVLGKPLAGALAACALLCSFVGGFRWWRLQQGLLRDVAISGGREVLIMTGIVGAITITFLGLIVAVDIDKEHKK